MGVFRLFGYRRNSKRLVVFFLFLLLPSVFTYSQNSLLTLSLEPKRVVKNEYLYITIIVDHPDPDEVSLTPPRFPSSLQLYWGPTIRPKTISSEGETRRVTEITYKFRTLSSGWFQIDSFRISLGKERKYETATLPSAFGVGIKKNGALIIPAEAEWVVKKREIFQGEAIPVTLRLKDQESIGMITSIQTKPPDEGLFENIKPLGEITKRPIGDMQLYSVPVASFMYTPTSAGRVILPEAFVEDEQITVKAESLSLQVLPLPEGTGISGAIGDFHVKAWLEKDNLNVGEDIVLHVRLEGEGNLNYCKLPEPVFQKGVVTKEESFHEYVPGDSGYKGYQENIYTYTSLDSTSREIIIPRFSWFDPKLGRVQTQKNRAVPLTLHSDDSEGLIREAGSSPLLGIKRSEEIKITKAGELYDSVKSYALFIPGIAVFFLCVFFKKIRFLFVALLFLFLAAGKFEDSPAAGESLNLGIEAFDAESYEHACEYFEEFLLYYPENSGVLYNLGVANYELENFGEALYFLRKANFFNPRDKMIIHGIGSLEEKLQLTDQSVPLFNYHPRLFFILLILLGNSALVFAGVYFLFRKSIFAISMILLLSFSMGALGMLVFSAIERTHVIGVAAEETSIKKIPGAKASDWFFVKEGASLRLFYTNEGYHFIQTETGLKGWVEEDSLLLINPAFKTET